MRFGIDDQLADMMAARHRRDTQWRVELAEKVADAMVEKWSGNEAGLVREAAEAGFDELRLFYGRQALALSNALHLGHDELAALLRRIMAVAELELVTMGERDREALEP